MSLDNGTHDLKRIIAQYKLRKIAYYDRFSGTVAMPDWPQPKKASPHATISRLLEWAATSSPEARPRTIYITGGATAGDRPGHDTADDTAVDRYWAAPCLDGWSITSWRREPWHVSYTRDQVAVDVAMGSAWFGDEHDAVKCTRSWALLSAMLRHTFDDHAVLMGSPGRTGADLLQRSLRAGATYPRIRADVRELLVNKFSQGRMEQPGTYVSPTADGRAPGIFVLDARWMYAGALRHLPTGPVEWERKSPVFHGYRRGVYHISTRVPDDWRHVGLAPTRSAGDGATVWPRTPGCFIADSWITGAELSVLYENAWPVNILEAIVYAKEDAAGHDPARLWVERMIELRRWAELNHDQLAMYAIRHMIIDTVGYWHRQARPDVRWLPYASLGSAGGAVPDNAIMVLPLREGIRYSVPAPLDPVTDPMYRPEWSVQVWGSSRAKLNKMALSFDPARELWLRHDSIVLDYDPQLPDTGKIGQWRVKKAHRASCEAPLSENMYRQLMKEAE